MWQTIGHEKAIRTLQRGLQEDRLSHAYLLVGPAQVGKMTLALDLARLVNCTGEDKPCGDCSQCRRVSDSLHTDVHVLGLEAQKGGDGRTRVQIGIDQVRTVQREASLKPYEGRYRVFIFDGAEHFSEEAANALLKTLEEPPDDVILVLLASDAGSLLPTLISRCTQLELRPLPFSRVADELEAKHGIDHTKAVEIARLSGGRLGWALEALSKPELLEQRSERIEIIENTVRGSLEDRFSFAAALASRFTRDRESVRRELALWLEWWRDVMVTKEGVPNLVTNLSKLDGVQATADALSSAQIAGAIAAINETAEHLERNVNPRLALEGLMLALPRL